MKRKTLIFIIVLGVLLGIEVWLICFGCREHYPDIADSLEKAEQIGVEGQILHLKNLSINGRDYTEISFTVEQGAARIISLKTEDNVLFIPAKLGKYPVDKIGGQLGEIPVAEKYARMNQKTPLLGVYAWMSEKDKGYKEIVIEEGIKSIYAESFYGVKADAVKFPKSLLIIGALAFGEADIQKVTVGNSDICIERDAFEGTKLRKQFPESSIQKRESIEEKYQNTFHEVVFPTSTPEVLYDR